jgi:hypothetical protein
VEADVRALDLDSAEATAAIGPEVDPDPPGADFDVAGNGVPVKDGCPAGIGLAAAEESIPDPERMVVLLDGGPAPGEDGDVG